MEINKVEFWVFAVLGVLNFAIFARSVTVNPCPAGWRGLLPHPTVRNKYIECGHRSFSYQNCRPSTVFNPTTKRCDNPINFPKSAEDYDSCVDPRGQQGVCRDIITCEPLLKILKKFGNTEYLQQSVCSYKNFDALMCCPDTGNKIITNNNNNNINNNINNNNKRLRPTQQRTDSYGPLLPPACGHVDVIHPRIIDGESAQLGSWPWAALLGYSDSEKPGKPRFRCGGSLVSARHVLTAAHCVFAEKPYLVRLGELDIEDDNDNATPIDLSIESITHHPRFNPSRHINDVAIIKLIRDVQFTATIKPICLPVTEEIRKADISNALPFVVGWGALEYFGAQSSRLRQVQLPIVDLNRCKTAYKNNVAVIDENVLCAGYSKPGKDTCEGDSGGPLMVSIGKTWYSIGVVSNGMGCALGAPGVYAKTEAFLNFISPLLR